MKRHYQCTHQLLLLTAVFGCTLMLVLPSLAAPLMQGSSTLNVNVSTSGVWVGGFNGAIKITNPGAASVNGWTLVFVLNGATIDSAWNGTLTKDAQGRYVLTNEGWNGTIAPGGSVDVGFTATGSFNGLSYCTINNQSCGGVSLATATPTSPPGPVPAPAWPARFFAPYIDATGWPPFPMLTTAQNQNIKFFTLAFVVNSGATPCKATWGGYNSYAVGQFLSEDIKALRRLGGDVMVSFGGAAGTELAASCTDVPSLKAQYQATIDAYGLTHIDFDIEGQAVAEPTSIARRSQAIAALQADARAAGKELKVWYTLPVLPTGLDSNGVKVLQAALDNGVDLAGVNIMAMDYGDTTAPNPSGQMGQYAIQAATSLFSQMKSAYAAKHIVKSDADLWHMVGVTPMIGLNDVQTEVFTLKNAEELVKFAQDQNFGMLAMWSLNRDKQCANGASNNVEITCSSILQDEFGFSSIFNPFSGGVSPTPTPTATLPAGVTPTATTAPPSPTPTQVTPTATATKAPPTPTPTSVNGNTSCQVDYLITTDWGSGFNTNVVISNRSANALSSWKLTWTFPGNQKISTLWNGNYTQSGAAVNVTNAGWNGAISSGGSVSIGFGASYTGSNQPPTNFTVNGVACNQSNVQPTPTATATKASATATATNPPTATKTPTKVPPTATTLPGTPTSTPFPTATPTTTATPVSNVTDKQVIGYFVQWGIYARNYHVKNIVMSGAANNLTMINYAFGNIVNGQCIMTTQSGVMDAYADYQKSYTADQSVDGVADQWNQPLRGNFNQLRKLKALYPQLKVLISLGGWTWSGGFHDAALTAASRQKMVQSCIDIYIRGNLPAIDSAGGTGAGAGLFDGIDIDWEFPAANGNNQPYGSEDTQNYTLLLQEFRRQLDAINPKLMLTVATNAGVDKYSKLELGKIAQYLNYVNLMTYDLHGAWERTTGHGAPLYPSSNAPYTAPASTYAVDTAVQGYLAGGVPTSKLIVGIPFYGRGWSGVPNSNNGLWQVATNAAPGTYEAGVDDYKVLQALNYPVYRDDNVAAVWKYNGDIFWTYDDEQTIATKMKYIRDHNLAGAMAWSIDGDNGTLLPAMYKGLQNSVATAVRADNGGSLAFTDASGSATTIVEVPAGAVTATITLKSQAIAPTGNTNGLQPTANGFVLTAYQNGEPLTNFKFAKPITVTIQYSDADVAGRNEADLKLFYFDTANQRWVDAATSCSPTSIYDRHPDQNFFAVAICHLTQFGVFAQPASTQVYLPAIQR
ncbi:MAG: glycosyl hydrolase family 18 protein [Caldilineaceae bacterium]